MKKRELLYFICLFIVGLIIAGYEYILIHQNDTPPGFSYEPHQIVTSVNSQIKAVPDILDVMDFGSTTVEYSKVSPGFEYVHATGVFIYKGPQTVQYAGTATTTTHVELLSIICDIHHNSCGLNSYYFDQGYTGKFVFSPSQFPDYTIVKNTIKQTASTTTGQLVIEHTETQDACYTNQYILDVEKQQITQLSYPSCAPAGIGSTTPTDLKIQ